MLEWKGNLSEIIKHVIRTIDQIFRTIKLKPNGKIPKFYPNTYDAIYIAVMNRAKTQTGIYITYYKNSVPVKFQSADRVNFIVKLLKLSCSLSGLSRFSLIISIKCATYRLFVAKRWLCLVGNLGAKIDTTAIVILQQK